MGTSITTRLILVITVIQGMFFFACKAGKDIPKPYTDKSTFIQEYKVFYFRRCLAYGYENSSAILEVLAKDNSRYSELILGERYHFLDSLAKETGEKIKNEAAQRVGKVAEGAEGKRILLTSLNEYNSKRLDSLAKAHYREYQKEQKRFLKSL